VKIAFFTNNYLPNPYGVSTSVDGFYRGLVAAGHEVSIFAPHWPGDDAGSTPDVYRYPSVAVPTKVPFALALPYSPEIDKFIDAQEFDIIHAHHPNILGMAARRWASKKDIPLVFTWHSRYDHYTHYASLIPEDVAMRWVMHNAYQFAARADHVIFPTQSVSDLYSDDLDQHRISIVPSGVNEDLFADALPLSVRERHRIPRDAKLLITVSRLSQEKNIIFLMRSVRRFLRNHSDIYFVVCGEGELYAEAEKLFDEDGVRDRVIFVGRIAREVVKDYLAAADVFVYSSTTETQGTIVTEAMYSGVPIVAVRATGVTDLVEDGVSGILTDEKWSDFVYALEKITYDVDYRSTLGQHAYAQAHADYTVGVCTQKLLTVYEKTLGDYKSE